MIIDTHAHLDHVEDLDKILEEAHQAGVDGILAVGVDLDANLKNLDIKQRFSSPQIRVGLGLHPGNIKTEAIEETISFIEQNIHEAVAVGEIGLDFWYRWVRKNEEKKTEQKEVFRRQLSIAKAAGLPVVIHSRGAWKHCLEIVRKMEMTKGVFHWYSGPMDILKEILDLGFYVSCTPSLSYSLEAQAAMESAPIERILIETDTPVFFRDKNSQEPGFQSGPKDVLRTLSILARLKKMDEADAAQVLNSNAAQLFGF